MAILEKRSAISFLKTNLAKGGFEKYPRAYVFGLELSSEWGSGLLRY